MNPNDILVTEVPSDPTKKFLFATQLKVSFIFETTKATFQQDFCTALEDTFLRHMAAFYEKSLSVGPDGKIVVQDGGPEQKVRHKHVN